MYIVIDCETTGLPRNWKAPVSDAANWPRVVQLAWSRIDGQLGKIESVSRLIRPDGFVIPAAAERVHRISTRRATEEGMPLAAVLGEFAGAVGQSEVVVAHNLQFDESVLSAEYLRCGMEPPFGAKRRICTMRRSAGLCRLPGAYGYKWPSLAELHRTLFGTGFEEAHDAAADVTACADCFIELERRRLLD